MDGHSSAAFHWTERLDPKTWIKAFFSEFPKCDILLNNNSEVFNSYILDGKEMAVLSMLEYIFYKIMQRLVSKQREAIEKWAGQRICPKIKKKLDKNTEFAPNYHVSEAGQQIFRVLSGNSSYTVDLCLHTCDCKRWQLSGVPCGHSIACCREEKIDPETMVHDCYIVENYLEAYGYILIPLRDPKHWEVQNGYKVFPPVADHNRKGHYRWQEALVEEGVELVDENYDDPTFLQNIFPNRADPRLDPSESPTSMVFNMANRERERARRAHQRVHGPLPEQSSFVAAAGAAIPQPRVTTEMNIGRQTRATTIADMAEGSEATARGRGRKRRGRGEGNPDARRGRGASAFSRTGRGASAVSGTGRGASGVSGTGRGGNAVSGTGRGASEGSGIGRGASGASVDAGRGRGGRNVHAWRGRGGRHADAGRGRGGRHADTGRGRGVLPGQRAWWLLFGDDMGSQIPDLNAPPDEIPHA